ncbi:copper resistance CopC/CopD family protein [Falsibacillus pallidus]|uniref:Copper transport protein n=1 Tax=Falsibacillus pallidus TaxID=493781 RepID=A0A370G7Y2_9BACI|nr:copper resistance protein CopC [Falsibacillus pallidus]RDI39905.1 copper transport protein [Falsibacillus pallidus]
MRIHKGRLWLLLLSLLVIFNLLTPKSADAHAVLLSASPSENSTLKTAPDQIILTFNERLESSLYEIKVKDSNGKEADSSKALLSKNHHQMSLKLPPLKNGVYSVTYRATSQDGHPVGSTYVFSIGKPLSDSDKSQILGSTGSSSPFGLVWFFRSIYYVSLLLLTGWLAWRIISPDSFITMPNEKKWLMRMKWFYLYMMIIIGIGPNADVLLSGHSLNVNNLIPFFTGTAFGITWGLSLIISIAGLWIGGKSKWFDGFWILSLLALEGVNGHANTTVPKIFGITFDIVHLGSAAIWTGGLFYILIFWKSHREQAKKFIPRFSQGALASMILLFLTGGILTLMLAGDTSYLTKDLWGILLLSKIGLACVVLIIGAVLRKKVATIQENGFRKWFWADLTLMILITAIVGGLTYTSPLPENKPIEWASTQNGFKVSTNAAPAQPGISSHIQVKIDTPDGRNPNDVQLVLKPLGKEETEPIQVPLKSDKNTGNSFLYSADGIYFPAPGDWQMEIIVYDSKDNYSVFKKEFTLYEINTQ